MTEATTPNLGRGNLSATVLGGVQGTATGGRYLIDGKGTLTPQPDGASAPAAPHSHGALKSMGDWAHLHGGGSLTNIVNTTLTFFPVTGYYNAVADPSISGVLNSPIVQPISALVTFTPRLDKGQLLYVSDYLVSPAYNALQVVTLIGNVTGGSWTLSFGAETTGPLQWDIAPVDLQAALGALTSIGGTDNINVVAGVSPLSYNIEFIHALGNQWMPPLVGNADELINPQGPGFCEVTTTVTLLGSPEIVADTAIALPPLTARIYNGVLSTIDRVDTPGFQLTANSGNLNVGGDLIYDVSFTNITYNQSSQTLAPFAFKAPTDATPVCLTDPTLTKLPYQLPSTTTWSPPQTGQPTNVAGRGLELVSSKRTTWRERAGVA